MIIQKEVRRGAQCVFKGLCDHAPATHIAYHEFANYPPKPLCAEHARRVERVMATPKKRK